MSNTLLTNKAIPDFDHDGIVKFVEMTQLNDVILSAYTPDEIAALVGHFCYKIESTQHKFTFREFYFARKDILPVHVAYLMHTSPNTKITMYTPSPRHSKKLEAAVGAIVELASARDPGSSRVGSLSVSVTDAAKFKSLVTPAIPDALLKSSSEPLPKHPRV